jgi:hypothetical protein
MVGGIRKMSAGSIAGNHIGPEELARELLGGQKLPANGRKVVTMGDMAIFLMILRLFNDHMNVNGSLPTARWRGLRTAMHESGVIDRTWCHHRYVAMRDLLSARELLAWQDQGYVIGDLGLNGRYIPGNAAKWRAGSRLMALLEEMEKKEVVDGVVDHGACRTIGEEKSMAHASRDQAQGQDQGKEEERGILYGCKDQDQQEDQGKGGASFMDATLINPPTSLHA